MILRKLWRDEQGQALIFFAIMSLGLIAITALVIDGGMAFLQRTRMQRAADAATKAGTWVLANPAATPTDSAVDTAVTTYATNNGWSGSPPLVKKYINTSGTELGDVGAGTIPADTGGVRVTTSVSFNTFFAGIIGRGGLTATARATAIYGPISAGRCLFPAIVHVDEFQNWTEGSCVYLRNIDTASNAPGNFGWINWAGQTPSISTLDGNLTLTGCPSGTISVGDDMNGQVGNTITPVQDELHPFLGQQTIVTVYDTVAGTGDNALYNTVGFAGVRIQGFKETGAGASQIHTEAPGGACPISAAALGLSQQSFNTWIGVGASVESFVTEGQVVTGGATTRTNLFAINLIE